MTQTTSSAVAAHIKAEDKIKIGEYLRGALDGRKIFEIFIKTPGLFDIRQLANTRIIGLIDKLPDNLLPDFSKLSVSRRVSLFIESQDARRLVTFTPAEIKNISFYDYIRLISVREGEKFLDKERVSSLNDSGKSQVFLLQPGWYKTNIGMPANFTSRMMDELSHSRPDFIDENYETIKGSRISGYAWDELIKHSYKKYAPRLMAYLERLSPTDTRRVFNHRPALVQHLTVERIEASKLTAKEWLYVLCDATSTPRNLRYLSEPIIDYLAAAAAMDICGGSIQSRQLRNAVLTLRQRVEKAKKTVAETAAQPVA